MKFNTIASLAVLAASAYAQNCGHECDKTKAPSSVTSGDITLVAVVDNKDQNIKYHVGGKVVVENDCTFKVVDFWLDQAPREFKWHCTGPTNTGIAISNEVVPAVPKDAPREFTYDVSNTDPFCHAALTQDCDTYILMDNDYQTIAQAKVTLPSGTTEYKGDANASTGASNTAASGAGASSSASATGATPSAAAGSSSSSAPSGSSSTTSSTGAASGNKTSDATTSKWSMALLGLTSLAAFLLA